LILDEAELAWSIRKRINSHDRRRGCGVVWSCHHQTRNFSIRHKSNCTEDVGSERRADRPLIGLTRIDEMVYIAWINGTEAVPGSLTTVLRDGVQIVSYCLIAWAWPISVKGSP
jgi:hypothetical protein